MTAAPLVILLLLESEQTDADLRLIDLCMSVSVLGANMQLATSLSHLVNTSRRHRRAARVVVFAGLDAPDYDAVELIAALGAQPDLGLIAMVDHDDQRSLALAAGVDLALSSSIDRGEFLAQVHWLLEAYARASNAPFQADKWEAEDVGSFAPDPDPDAMADTLLGTDPARRSTPFRRLSWGLSRDGSLLRLPNARSVALDPQERSFLEALFLAHGATLSPNQCRRLLGSFITPMLQQRALMQIIHRLRGKCLAAGARLPLQGHPWHGYVFLDPCRVV